MANEDFNVSAGVKVKSDSNDLQKQIDKVAKSVKVKVKLNPELGDFQKKITSLTKNNKPYVKVSLKIDEKDLNKVKKQLKELSEKSYPAIIKPSVQGQNGAKTGGKSSGYDKDTIAIINKQKNALDGLVTTTEKYDAVNNKLSRDVKAVKKSEDELMTSTKKYKNSLGEIVTETEKLDVKTGEYSRVIKTVSDTTKVAKTNTTLLVDANGDLIKSVQTLNEKGEVLNTTWNRMSDGTKVVKEVVTKTADAMGVITTKTEQFNAQGQKIGSYTKVLNDQTKSTKQATEANEGFVASMARVLRFKIQNAIINTFTNSVYRAVDALKEIDSALVEFRKVSDLSGESLDRYIAKLADLGEITGSTISQMIEASTEFKKSGFSDEDSAELANVAQLYRNIADEELTAGESANFIIAQMKAFKDELGRFNTEAERAMFVIDAVNEVSNNYAVSSADLANNIGKVSATMANLGNSYEEVLGMMTAVTEVTRNASMASRGLRQISSRLVQVLDDSSSTGKKLIEIYKGLGIELYDSQGQLRSTYDILRDLSKQWDNLSTNERDYIALTSAGANQVQNFTALLENFNTAIDATATAEGASGSAMRENEKAMDSIEKKTNRLITQFQKLVWGEKGGLNDLLKHLIDLGTTMLKFANSDMGKVAISITAVVTVGNLLNLALTGISKRFTEIAIKSGIMASDLTLVNGALVATNTTTLTLTGSLKTLGNVIKSHPILFIGSVLAGVYSWINSNTDATNELSKSVSELATEYEKAQQDVKDTEGKLEKIKRAIDEINNRKNIEITDERQLGMLISEREELEAQLRLQKDIEAQKKKGLEEGARKTLEESKTPSKSTKNKQKANKYLKYIGLGFDVDEEDTPSIESQFKTDLKNLEIYSNSIASITETMRELESAGQANSDEYATLVRNLGYVREAYDSVHNRMADNVNIIKETIEPLSEESETYQKFNGYLEQYTNTLINVDKYTESSTSNISDSLIEMSNVAESLGMSVEDLQNVIGELDWADVVDDFNEYNDTLEEGAEVSIEEYIQQIFNLKEAVEESISPFEQWNNAIDDIQSSYDTLSSIVDSYNELGGYTVDNLQELLALSPEYLSMLSVENGQLVLNTQALQDKIIAQAEEAKAIVYDTAVTRLNELASQAQQNATKDAGDEAENAVSKWNDETEALQRNNVAKATYNALRSGADESDVDKVLSDLQLELDAIDNLVNNLTVDFTGGMGKSAKATSKATDSAKELNKELENLKSKYEKVISIIDKKLEKMMDDLEKQKDKVIDGIEDQINALKKLQDAEVNSYKKQIDYLQEMQQQEEDYWNEKINALKDQNKVIEEQNQLMKLQEALASAQASRVKVMKEGKFQYVQDDKAVDKARQDLIDYTKEQAYNQQLNLLEKMKKQAVSSYDSQINDLQNFVNNLNDKYEQQIKDLEALKDAKEKSFEAQIEQIQAYKDEFDGMVNAYQEEQDRLLVEQMTGINIEAQNWEQRLSNLTDFVNEYNSILAQLGTDNTGVSSSYSASKISDYETTKTATKDKLINQSKESVYKQGNTKDLILDKVSKMAINEYGSERQKELQQYYSSVYGGKTAQTPVKLTEEEKKKVIKRAYGAILGSHASGVGSIKSDELALVGDAPNKELVIGSKLNGQLMNLSKGTGVVNANSTRTVAGLLNSLGKSNAFTSGTNYTANDNSTSTTQQFSFGNISLPNVTDANSFVNELANNFKEYAVQNSHR